MNDTMMGRLSEYVDGTLTPAERADVDEWLATHSEGRGVVAELERVRRRAQSLPMREVPESVWLGVRAGIRGSGGVASGRGRRWIGRHVTFSAAQFAAAAALLLLVGGTATWWVLRGRMTSRAEVPAQPVATISHPTGGPRDSAAVAPVGAAPVAPRGQERLAANISRADESYDHAVSDLQSVVKRNRRRLSPATVKVIEESLARIDSAITRAGRALANDPGNTYLNDHMTRMRQRKLDLLERTAHLVSAS